MKEKHKVRYQIALILEVDVDIDLELPEDSKLAGVVELDDIGDDNPIKSALLEHVDKVMDNQHELHGDARARLEVAALRLAEEHPNEFRAYIHDCVGFHPPTQIV